MANLKMLSLFAGIGGIDLAGEWTGIETVCFCEINKFCQSKLNKNFPNVPIIGDIRDVTTDNLKQIGIDPRTIDIVAGGFPCQPFSVAGKRRGKEDDRYLWDEMFRVIREIKPAWIVGENVAGFTNMGLDEALSNLESEGYKTRAFNIPACAVGADHERKRVFIISNSKGAELPFSGDSWTRGIRFTDVCSDVSDPDKLNANESRFYPSGLSLKRSSGVSINQQWAVEPCVGRVANGVPNRVDRLKALGNAVVPQQVYPFLKAIVIIENNI